MRSAPASAAAVAGPREPALDFCVWVARARRSFRAQGRPDETSADGTLRGRSVSFPATSRAGRLPAAAHQCRARGGCEGTSQCPTCPRCELEATGWASCQRHCPRRCTDAVTPAGAAHDYRRQEALLTEKLRLPPPHHRQRGAVVGSVASRVSSPGAVASARGCGYSVDSASPPLQQPAWVCDWVAAGGYAP